MSSCKIQEITRIPLLLPDPTDPGYRTIVNQHCRMGYRPKTIEIVIVIIGNVFAMASDGAKNQASVQARARASLTIRRSSNFK